MASFVRILCQSSFIKIDLFVTIEQEICHFFTGDLDHLLHYETCRQREVIPMMTAIDTLKRLFSTSFFPFVFARTVGLQATNALTPLKVRRAVWVCTRLMMISPLYPNGKPCSRGTHNETVKNLALFSSIINGMMKELRLRISIPWECFQFSIESKILSHFHLNNSNSQISQSDWYWRNCEVWA